MEKNIPNGNSMCKSTASAHAHAHTLWDIQVTLGWTLEVNGGMTRDEAGEL